MKDKWEIGLRFDPYLSLNLRMVVPYYVFMILLSCIGLEIAAYLLLIPALTKLYSTTLYHKQAYLYQSVPVSAFETVLAKTLAGAIGALIPALCALVTELLLSLPWPWTAGSGETGGTSSVKFGFYEELKRLGLMLHAPAGTVVYILNLAALAFLVCGIALFGVSVGNRMRENRDKKPNTGTAVLVISGLLLLVYGAAWILGQMAFLSPLTLQILSLGLRIGGAVLLFRLNVRALDMWYSI